MDPDEWRAKLPALLTVLGVRELRRLNILEPLVLLELLNSPHSVAARVLELKLMCPATDVSAYIQRWPAMLKGSLWGSMLLAHVGRHPSSFSEQSVWSVAFTPDGQHLLSSGSDSTLRQWVLASRRCIQTISGFDKLVDILAVNTCNPSEVWGGGSGLLRACDLPDPVSCALLQDGSPAAPKMAVAFAPDGSQAVSVAQRDLSVWDVATRTRLARLDWGVWGRQPVAQRGGGVHARRQPHRVRHRGRDGTCV